MPIDDLLIEDVEFFEDSDINIVASEDDDIEIIEVENLDISTAAAIAAAAAAQASAEAANESATAANASAEAANESAVAANASAEAAAASAFAANQSAGNASGSATTATNAAGVAVGAAGTAQEDAAAANASAEAAATSAFSAGQSAASAAEDADRAEAAAEAAEEIAGFNPSLYMLKTAYDSNEDGKVNSADTADSAATAGSVDWSGVNNKPTTLGGYGITDAATSDQGAKADTAVQPADIAPLAPKNSPALEGTPTTPTAAPGTDNSQIANTAFVAAALAALVDSSPAALDTLNELAAALGDDPNFATTVIDALALKAPQSTTYTKTEVDEFLDNKADKVTTYTKTEVDAFIASAGTSLAAAYKYEGFFG